jgi:hypothetical protein
MPLWVFWLMCIVTASAFAFYTRERKLFSQKLRELSQKQVGTERALTEFIEESEKIAREFSKRMPAVVTEPLVAPVAVTRKRRGSDKKHQVLNLAGKGQPVNEIAERLMLPAGEVELILNLNQNRRAKGQTATV